jgi:hypothetical protein
MANTRKRLDNKLKAATPDAKKAQTKAGPRTLRNSEAPTPTLGRVSRLGRSS